MTIDRRPTPTNADRTTQVKGVSRFAGKKYQPQTHTEAHRQKDVRPLRGKKDVEIKNSCLRQSARVCG